MDSGHVLGAISPFASGQSRTSLDWIENDTDMGNFAREILEGEMSLDQDLFKGLPTPDFGYAASGQGAPDKGNYIGDARFNRFEAFAAQLDSYADGMPTASYAPQAFNGPPHRQQQQQQQQPVYSQVQHQQQQQQQFQWYQQHLQEHPQQLQPPENPRFGSTQAYWQSPTQREEAGLLDGQSEYPFIDDIPVKGYGLQTGTSMNPGLGSGVYPREMMPPIGPARELATDQLTPNHVSLSTGSGSSDEVKTMIPDKKDGDLGGGKVAKQFESFKERNRVTQKRYRERQKNKLADSEEKVAELTEQLSLLRNEKETLSTRNALLEKFISMQQQAAAAGSTSIVEGATNAWWLDDRTKRLIEQTLRLNGTLTFTVRPGQTLRLTRQQVADLPEDTFGALWKEYVNAYADCLLKADNNPESPAGHRLAQLVYESGQLKGSIAVTSPHRMGRSYPTCSIKDTLSSKTCLLSDSSSQLEERSRKLVRSVLFTGQQQKVLMSLRKLYLQNLGTLVRRRRDLTASLQVALPLADLRQGGTGVYVNTITVMDRLRDTLRDEHSFLVQFMLTVWRRIFTPFQVAHINVQSYPQQPDILGMINCLAEDLGELPAMEVLRMGATAPGDSALVPIDTVAALLPPDTNLHYSPLDQPEGVVVTPKFALQDDESSASKDPVNPPVVSSA